MQCTLSCRTWMNLMPLVHCTWKGVGSCITYLWVKKNFHINATFSAYCLSICSTICLLISISLCTQSSIWAWIGSFLFNFSCLYSPSFLPRNYLLVLTVNGDTADLLAEVFLLLSPLDDTSDNASDSISNIVIWLNTVLIILCNCWSSTGWLSWSHGIIKINTF